MRDWRATVVCPVLTGDVDVGAQAVRAHRSEEAAMAARDEQGPTNWLSPVDALRRVQELGEQLASAARSYSQGGRAEDEDEPAPPPASMAAWAERAAELSTMWVSPMRAMLEEQQDLIDAIASWADAQRELAERFSELADRHRNVTDGILATLTPTLDHLDRLAGRAPGGTRAAKPSRGAKAAKKRAAP
jgi:hypothetical protein